MRDALRSEAHAVCFGRLTDPTRSCTSSRSTPELPWSRCLVLPDWPSPAQSAHPLPGLRLRALPCMATQMGMATRSACLPKMAPRLASRRHVCHVFMLVGTN